MLNIISRSVYQLNPTGPKKVVSNLIAGLKQALTERTKLLIIGAHQGGGTDGLEEVIGFARSLNPRIKVVGYSACKLDGLLIDSMISKSEEGSIPKMVLEVQQVMLTT